MLGVVQYLTSNYTIQLQWWRTLYWYKNRHINGIKQNLEVKQQNYGHLVFDKGDKNIPWLKKTAYSINGLEFHPQKNEIRFVSFFLYKNQFKMDQNLKPETLKVSEENTGDTRQDVGVGKDI